LKDRIRELCEQLITSEDPVAAQVVADELRRAIHTHVEALRASLNEIPAVVDRFQLLG
jgi:hypothetical protein